MIGITALFLPSEGGGEIRRHRRHGKLCVYKALDRNCDCLLSLHMQSQHAEVFECSCQVFQDSISNPCRPSHKQCPLSIIAQIVMIVYSRIKTV